MPLHTAFLLIDCQVGLLEGDWPVVGAESLIPRWADLLQRARDVGMPVFLVRHGEGPGTPLEHGTPGWQVHPHIGPRPDDTYFDKTTPDAFASTALADELKQRGINHLIIAGLEGPQCVRSTTLGALERGLKVTLIQDAHGTYNTESQTAQQITQAVNDELADRVTLVAAAKVKFDRAIGGAAR